MKDKQIAFLKAQIEDINYLLEKADKGYEVGDIFKLESKKEQLENKLTKLIGDDKYEGDDIKESEIDFLEVAQIRGRIEKLEAARKKKTFILVTIGLFVWMTIVAIIGTYNSNKINIEEVKATKEKVEKLEKQNYCYKVLYNEDIIGNECDDLFKNDDWYKEYINEGKVEK